MVVSGAWDNIAIVWDVTTMTMIRAFKAHEYWVVSVIWFNNEVIGTGSRDSTIRVWKAKTGEVLYTNKDHQGTVHTLALSPDGKTLASGSQDMTVKIFDASRIKCIKTINFDQSVERVTFASSEVLLVGPEVSRAVSIDLSSGNTLVEYSNHGFMGGIEHFPKLCS